MSDESLDDNGAKLLTKVTEKLLSAPGDLESLESLVRSLHRGI